MERERETGEERVSRMVRVLVIGNQYARSEQKVEEKSRGDNGWE